MVFREWRHILIKTDPEIKGLRFFYHDLKEHIVHFPVTRFLY